MPEQHASDRLICPKKTCLFPIRHQNPSLFARINQSRYVTGECSDHWTVLVLERCRAMHELQAGGCPRVLDALTLPAHPNVASQEDATGLCSPSSSVFSHPKADAPAQHLVSVLALLAISHRAAALNCFCPAASPSSFPS